LVMSQSQAVMNCYEQYEKSKNAAQLINDLKNLCTETEKDDSSDEEAKEKTRDTVDILSSPGDNGLMRMKKRRKSNKVTTPQEVQPQMFGNNVQSCDPGLSPKIIFDKRARREAEESDDD